MLSRRLFVPVVLTAVFLSPLGIAGTSVALPRIAVDLGSDPVALQAVVNAFNASFALSMLGSGLLTDRAGPRRVFVVGVLLLLISSILSAAAPTLVTLGVARLLAGAGGASVITSGTAMLSDAFPSGPVRSRVFASLGTAVGVALALGPLVSGVLVAVVGWRGVYVAFALVAGGVLALRSVLPGPRAAAAPGDRPRRRGDLLNRRFLAFALVPLAPAVGFVTVLTYLPVTLSAMFGMGPVEASLVLVAMTAPVLVAPFLAVRLVRTLARVSPGAVVVASFAGLVLGDLGLLLLSPDLPVAWALPALVLLGFGYGLPLGLVDSEATAAVPDRALGRAVGVLNLLRAGGGAVTVGAYGVAVAALVGTSLPEATAARVAAGEPGNAPAFADAFHTVVITLAVVVAVLACVVTWLLSTSRGGDPRGRTPR